MTSAAKSAEIAIAKTQKLSTDGKKYNREVTMYIFLSADEKKSYNRAMYLLSAAIGRYVGFGGFNVIAVYDYKLHSFSTQHSRKAGRYSSVGSDVAWESRGTVIDPRIRHIFS